MNQVPARGRIARLGLGPLILAMSIGVSIANAQTATPMEVSAILNAGDFGFAGQANVRAPSQFGSGLLAVSSATLGALLTFLIAYIVASD